MWRTINDGNINAVLHKMSNELQMDLDTIAYGSNVWYYYDTKHFDVKNVAMLSKSMGLDVMLSIANTDGTFKTSGTRNTI